MTTNNLIKHAKRELEIIGSEKEQKEYPKVFTKLANFEPLSPLTGEDSEWTEIADGVFQNKRCSHVFKQHDRFGGQAYDIDGKVFREPNGNCYTSIDSFVPITFPYVPQTIYVDVGQDSLSEEEDK